MIRHICSTCRPGMPDSARSVGRVRLDGHAKQAVETGRKRLMLTSIGFLVAFGLVGLRLVDLTMLRAEDVRRTAKVASGEGIAGRANITDRNGTVLATSLKTYSLYADPSQVLDAADAAERLHRVLPELEADDLLRKLSSARKFVWLRRHMTPRQYYAVNTLGLPGVNVLQDEHRVYPHGRLTSHIVGFTDIDSRGLGGLEQSLNARLSESSAPVRLTIDLRAQHILRHEMQSAIDTFEASGASGLIMDVATGAVVAMVSLPDFNPNEPDEAHADARFNRNTLGVYEMGSTFKIFNTAAALESGLIDLQSRYSVAHPIRVAGFTIRDFKPHGKELSVPEIFVYSSNIGSAQMAVELGADRQRAFLARLGLLDPASIELPEIGTPMAPAPWREINVMTISYGYGVAVSPLQLATAVATVTNGGFKVTPTLLQSPRPDAETRQRLVSGRTSRIMTELLRQVVLHGTGRKADVPGYAVGGKTGTADKYTDRRDKRGLLSSFVGVFPSDAPRYVVVITVDEPKGNKDTFGYATGGWVAAPAVGRVIANVAPLLGVEPVFDEPGKDGPAIINVKTGDKSVASLGTGE